MVDNLRKMKIGIYGPRYSGKSSLVMTIFFPKRSLITSDAIVGFDLGVPLTVKETVKWNRSEYELEIVEYPDGHLPLHDDKCDRYIIMTTRDKIHWESYYNSGLSFLDANSLITVSTCMDTMKGKLRADDAPDLTQKVSLRKPGDREIVRYFILSPEFKRMKSKVRKRKKKSTQPDADGWIKA